MRNKPRSERPERFPPAKILARRLAPLGASVEGAGNWRLVVPFGKLEELKERRRRITTLLRRHKGLIEERPDIVDGDGSRARKNLTRART